jgi:hypothetical protein
VEKDRREDGLFVGMKTHSVPMTLKLEFAKL